MANPLNVWLEPAGRMLLDYPQHGDPQEIAERAAADIRRQKIPHLHPESRIEVSRLRSRRSGREILASVRIVPDSLKIAEE